MPRPPLRFAVFAALLLVVNITGLALIYASLADSGQRKVRVLTVAPETDADNADRFVLVFDEALGAGAALGEPAVRVPFVLAPLPEGYWTWAAPDRLEFVLARRLPPGRIYELAPAGDFTAQTARTIVGPQSFRFQTRALVLISCVLDSADRTDANILLTFNQPVLPADLLRHLRVTGLKANGEPRAKEPELTATCLAQAPADRIVVRIPRQDLQHVQLDLDERLTGVDGQRPLPAKISRRIDIAPPFGLVRAYVDEPTLDGDPIVTLDFTESLDPDQTLPPIRIEPAITNPRMSFRWDEIRITGPFKPQQRYTATVPANLLSAEGHPLGEAQSISFSVPDYSPQVQFDERDGVLSPLGNLLLAGRLVNVAGVDVSVDRVLANNLVPHLRGDDAPATARSLLSRTVAILTQRNTPEPFAVDLRRLIDAPLGIYHVGMSATDHAWTSDSAVVTVTDLAITCKREPESLWTWVTALRTAQPTAGATVKAWSYNNQVLATATTDSNGIARLNVAEADPDGPAWVVTAELGDDLAYLQPEARLWMLDEVDQSGRRPPEHYDVLLYPERGVYRPGETVHVTGIIRDSFGGTPGGFPLAVAIDRPDGQRIEQRTITPAAGAGGTFHFDYATPADGQMGRYAFTVTIPGDEAPLGRTDALVEAFLPARMTVSAEPDAAVYLREQAPAVHVDAEYLFGKPAGGLPVRIMGNYAAQRYISQRHPDFTFGLPLDGPRRMMTPIDDALDSNGSADVLVPAPDDDPPPGGIWLGTLSATVTDPGGRSISSNFEMRVDPADQHLGLRSPAGTYVPARTEVRIDCVQVDALDASTTPAPFDLVLARVEYDWAVRVVDGRQTWQTIERRTPVWQQRFDAPADVASTGLRITCPDAGSYRLTATGDDDGVATELALYALDGASADGVAVERPERVEVAFEQTRYAPGSEAVAQLRLPFAGTLLVTLETDRVVWSEVIDAADRSLSVRIPVPADIRGGGFLTCSLIREVDPSASTWLPHRAMGMTRLVADHAAQRLDVQLDAPAEAEPGAAVAVTVRCTAAVGSDGPRRVHLWAVDDGILLTTGYRCLDPWARFFAPPASRVDTADVFFDLLPDHNRPASLKRIGADGDFEDYQNLLHEPVSTTTRASGVVWNEFVDAGPDGNATLTLTMPALTGRMRLMAVVVDRDRYGCAERTLQLSAPLMIELPQPRFAAPHDVFELPARIVNNTPAALDVTLAISASGVLALTQEAEGENLHVEAGGTAIRWIEVTAAEVGEGAVTIRASARTPAGAELTAVETARLPVRRYQPLDCRRRVFEVPAGETLVIPPPTELDPASATTEVVITSRPDIDLLSAAEALLDYPYGCIEQTTSRLFALLFGGEVLAEALPGDVRIQRAGEMIDAGLARLAAMQTRSGGLAYWAGDPNPDLWGSAYAARFLAEAQSAGRASRGDLAPRLAEYLKSVLQDEALADPSLRALVCRVLTELADPPHGWIAELSEHPEQLDMAGRADLAVAWLNAGRRDRALALLVDDTLQQRITPRTSGRITSQVRQEAELLDALCRVAPEHPWAPLLAQRLQAGQHNGLWGNTLENASALAALTRYRRRATAPADFRGTLRLADAELLAFDHTALARYTGLVRDQSLELTSSGAGSIFVSVMTRGLKLDEEVEEYDRGIRIRRTWQHADGGELDPRHLRVGDLIKATVTCTALAAVDDEPLANLAIVDALPAGLEAENPRLATSAQLDSGCATGLQRVEYRDDRVIAFGSVGTRPLVFEHYLRVIAAGSFAIPPVQAASMYDASVSSVSAGDGVMRSQP